MSKITLTEKEARELLAVLNEHPAANIIRDKMNAPAKPKKDGVKCTKEGERYRWEYPSGKVLFASFPYDAGFKIRKPSMAFLNKRLDPCHLKGSLFI